MAPTGTAEGSARRRRAERGPSRSALRRALRTPRPLLNTRRMGEHQVGWSPSSGASPSSSSAMSSTVVQICSHQTRTRRSISSTARLAQPAVSSTAAMTLSMASRRSPGLWRCPSSGGGKSPRSIPFDFAAPELVRSSVCRISRHHPPAAGRILCCSRWRDPSLAGSSLWRSSTSGSPRERSPLLAGHLRRQDRRRRRPRKRLRLRARQQARAPSRLQGPRRDQRTPCCTGPVRYGLVEQTWTPCRRMPPQG